MFDDDRGRDHGEPTLVDAWQALGSRHGLVIDVVDDESIRASGSYRGRPVTVDIHRDRKPTEPFHALAPKVRRNRMRHHWVTEVTVGCVDPNRSAGGAIQSFVDIRADSWDPRNHDPAHCRVVRTDPRSLGDRVFTASIHQRLASMRGDHQILVEPTRIRLVANDTARPGDGFFVGSPIHNEFPGASPPWPERALIGPPWWFDLLCDIADAVEGRDPARAMTVRPDLSSGSSWAESGGPFGPDASKGDGRGVVVFVALLASAIVLLGIGVFVATRDTSSSEVGDAGGTEPVPQATVPPGDSSGTPTVPVAPPVSDAPAQPPEEAPADLLTSDRIAGILDEIAAVSGTDPLRLVSVVVYPDYMYVQMQDPADPAAVVQYEWRGSLGAPAPVAPAGAGDLDAMLYSSEEVNWSAIAPLVAAAPDASGLEGGAVTHVDVKRSLPFSPDIRMRAFVTGTAESGFVDADANGTIIS